MRSVAAFSGANLGWAYWERSPETANAPNAAARKRMIRSLATDDPALLRVFGDALYQSEGSRHLMRESGHFPLCSQGDINFYAVLTKAMGDVVKKRGRVGCVLALRGPHDFMPTEPPV